MALLNFGDIDDVFGRVDRMMSSMNSVMRSMMGPAMADPFDIMGSMGGMSVTPFGQSFSVSSSPHGFSHFSSSVTTMTCDAYGRPQVYHQTQSSRTAPGGVRETHSTVRDSRTGLQQMSIGHHIHDRGHVMQRSRNYYTGDQEENEEYINIEETEAPEFDREWRRRANRYRGGYDRHYHRGAISSGPTVEPYLALPSSEEPTEITTEPIITEPSPSSSPSPSPSRNERRKARKHKQQQQGKSTLFKKKHARFE